MRHQIDVTCLQRGSGRVRVMVPQPNLMRCTGGGFWNPCSCSSPVPPSAGCLLGWEGKEWALLKFCGCSRPRLPTLRLPSPPPLHIPQRGTSDHFQHPSLQLSYRDGKALKGLLTGDPVTGDVLQFRRWQNTEPLQLTYSEVGRILVKGTAPYKTALPSDGLDTDSSCANIHKNHPLNL